MLSQNSKALREKIDEKSILKVGGAFDAMSAKLVEISGFDAVWAGSFAISATHAVPDASIMTMTEFLQVAKNMVDSCKIPIVADLLIKDMFFMFIFISYYSVSNTLCYFILIF